MSNKSGLWGHGRADQNLHLKFLVRVSSGCPIGPIDPYSKVVLSFDKWHCARTWRGLACWWLQMAGSARARIWRGLPVWCSQIAGSTRARMWRGLPVWCSQIAGSTRARIWRGLADWCSQIMGSLQTLLFVVLSLIYPVISERRLTPLNPNLKILPRCM